jgi:hypothetical protein
VVDEESVSDGRAGMNLNAGPEAGDLREVTRQQAEAAPPQPMVKTMKPDGMQARVEQHGEFAGRCRVAIQHGLYIFSNGSQHWSRLACEDLSRSDKGMSSV